MKRYLNLLFLICLCAIANAQRMGVVINNETIPYDGNNIDRVYEAILKYPADVSGDMLQSVADSYYTGILYYEFLNLGSVNKDIDKAFKLYSLLSQGNYEPKYMYHGLMRLGTMYIKGEGVPADEKKGFAKYVAAATEGNTDAQIFLAQSYLTGKYTDQDFKQAEFWFSKAADPVDGDPTSYSRNGYACYMLGNAYYDGSPLADGKIDYDKAVDYLRVNLRFLQRHFNEILENGDEEEIQSLANVCRKLQTCYRFGRGIEKDEEWADYLLEMASQLGDKDAESIMIYNQYTPRLY